jgi:phage gpG-like protein
MSVAVQVKISNEATALLMRLGNQPALMRAITKEMNNQMLGDDGLRTHIITQHLNAQPHPSDPSNHELGRVTSRLANSVYATTEGTATTVESHIGSNVKYARIHEYGGTIKRLQLAGSVHLRTDAKGNLLKGVARFASKKVNKKGELKHKRFLNVPYAGGKRFEIVMPERAPFRTGIAEKIDDVGKGISEAIVNYWGGGQ